MCAEGVGKLVAKGDSVGKSFPGFPGAKAGKGQPRLRRKVQPEVSNQLADRKQQWRDKPADNLGVFSMAEMKGHDEGIPRNLAGLGFGNKR